MAQLCSSVVLCLRREEQREVEGCGSWGLAVDLRHHNISGLSGCCVGEAPHNGSSGCLCCLHVYLIMGRKCVGVSQHVGRACQIVKCVGEVCDIVKCVQVTCVTLLSVCR